jgi:adenylate cyclase
MAGLLIRIYDREALAASEECEGPVEVGRQNDPDEPLYAQRQLSGRVRIVVAGIDEQAVSRRQALLEPRASGRLGVTNLSQTVPLRMIGGIAVEPGGAREVELPAVLMLGRKRVVVEPPDSDSENDDGSLQRLAEATVAPGRMLPARLRGTTTPEAGGVSVESLVSWLQGVLGVFHTATASPDFFDSAARAVVETLGMDTGSVCTLDPDGVWSDEARYPIDSPRSHPSRRMLERLKMEKRTLWRDPGARLESDSDESLLGVCSAIAAPILDRQGQVIGAIYGERKPGSASSLSSTGPRIRTLDAMLMELLASALAAGLARVEQEKAAMAAKVQFEQFFTPELAEELAARPDLLEGRDVEVTMLFADIKGFSRVSERIGPAKTVAWVGDVMETLSDCVIEHHGVLVDYLGDEIVAMWGAPKEQPDHPRLACLAALDMQVALPALDARWHHDLGVATDIGIGINTGHAQVGNTGSLRKFKYGALGNTVNIASRVQGVTRYLKTRLVVTESTQSRLDPSFATRRLGRASMVNIAEPVTLFELAEPNRAHWSELVREYETALCEFEAGRFREAIQILGTLLAENPDDGPSLVLLARAVNCVVEEPVDFDPVWKLPGK